MDFAVILAGMTLGRMVDPFVIAAGVIPVLAVKPWRQSLGAAAAAGAFLGVVVSLGYLGASFAGFILSVLATTAASLVWWTVVFWGMRLARQQNAK